MQAINDTVQAQPQSSESPDPSMLNTFEVLCRAQVIEWWDHDAIRDVITAAEEGADYNTDTVAEIALSVQRYLKTAGASSEISNQGMKLFLQLLSLSMDRGKKMTHFPMFAVHEPFGQTDKYLHVGRQAPPFPLEIHQMALEICRRVIQQGALTEKTKNWLFYTMPLIANHKDWSADEQLEIFNLGLQHAEDRWIDFVSTFARMEHASPFIRAGAVKLLCASALNEENSSTARESIIEHFPFFYGYQEVSEELRVQSFEVLEKILPDSKAPLKLRVSAARQLSLFPWSKNLESGPPVADLQERAIVVCLEHLESENTPKEIRKEIANTLFYCMSATDDSDPISQRLRVKDLKAMRNLAV